MAYRRRSFRGRRSYGRRSYGARRRAPRSRSGAYRLRRGFSSGGFKRAGRIGYRM